MHASKISIPSIDQLEYGECTLLASGKWNWDEDLRDQFNNACETLGFPYLSTLHDARVMMIICMCGNAFVSVDVACDKFNRIFE